MFMVNPYTTGVSGLPSQLVAISSAQSATGTLTITKPTGTVDGHLLIAVIADPNAGDSMSTPAGWTLVVGNAACQIYRKVAASEGSGYNFVSDNGSALSGSIAAFSALNYDAVGAMENSVTTTRTAATVTAASNNSLLLAIYTVAGASKTLTTPTDMNTLTYDGDATLPGYKIFWEDIPSGATGSKVSTTSINPGVGGSVLLTLKP